MLWNRVGKVCSATQACPRSVCVCVCGPVRVCVCMKHRRVKSVIPFFLDSTTDTTLWSVPVSVHSTRRHIYRCYGDGLILWASAGIQRLWLWEELQAVGEPAHGPGPGINPKTFSRGFCNHPPKQEVHLSRTTATLTWLSPGTPPVFLEDQARTPRFTGGSSQRHFWLYWNTEVTKQSSVFT